LAQPSECIRSPTTSHYTITSMQVTFSSHQNHCHFFITALSYFYAELYNSLFSTQ
jgi:hypothetical protein